MPLIHTEEVTGSIPVSPTAQRPVPIKGPAIFDLLAAANGGNHQASQSLSFRSASRVASDGASVEISIVTAILLCLRTRIATRGCTSARGVMLYVIACVFILFGLISILAPRRVVNFNRDQGRNHREVLSSGPVGGPRMANFEVGTQAAMEPYSLSSALSSSWHSAH